MTPRSMAIPEAMTAMTMPNGGQHQDGAALVPSAGQPARDAGQGAADGPGRFATTDPRDPALNHLHGPDVGSPKGPLERAGAQ